MSWTDGVDTAAMARSTFFTNHLRVLTTLAGRPDLRLREIAQEVGITEGHGDHGADAPSG
ncbi:MAG TPA: hypothetical protein VMA96_14840 [Solirubrobacteraceae bacterium]|nr:hypothetical protein [Solirubrobacteraceae bacterium]